MLTLFFKQQPKMKKRYSSYNTTMAEQTKISYEGLKDYLGYLYPEYDIHSIYRKYCEKLAAGDAEEIYSQLVAQLGNKKAPQKRVAPTDFFERLQFNRGNTCTEGSKERIDYEIRSALLFMAYEEQLEREKAVREADEECETLCSPTFEGSKAKVNQLLMDMHVECVNIETMVDVFEDFVSVNGEEIGTMLFKQAIIRVCADKACEEN